MSPKRTILRTLSRNFHESGPGILTRPSHIPGFQEKPDRYQQAINGLLQSRLIEGTKDPEGRMAITLNPMQLDAVRKELRPLWGHPFFWAAVAITMVLAGVGLSI